MSNKKLVFISHANPQDNDATLWLASKLSCSGYEVWSDLTQLFGGEVLWDDIEEAIRNHSAKFIVLVSRNSQLAQGVLDEVNVAVAIERKGNIPRFVIPLRMDNLPFNEFRANIARKKAIDFSSNWAEGLRELLAGFERDKVPKSDSGNPNDIAKWFHDYISPSANVVRKPQTLGSNWIPVTQFPEFIHFSRFPGSDIENRRAATAMKYPSFAYQRHIGSFASSSELQPGMSKWLLLSAGHSIDTTSFMTGDTPQFATLGRMESQNMVSGLLRKAWDSEMKDRGLLPYHLSSFNTAWFLPLGFTTQDSFQYVDIDHKTRKKKLVGRSERLKVYWHFAVSARPQFGRLMRFALRTHVVFTFDGRTPLSSGERMHAFRRSFCRSWWNERWRGLLLAYLSNLSDQGGQISLQVAPSCNVYLGGLPILFKSPISLEETGIPYVEIPDDVFFEDPLHDEDLELQEDLLDDVSQTMMPPINDSSVGDTNAS